MARNTFAVVAHVRSDAPPDTRHVAALAALGQPTRLEIFRLLMRREPEGLAAGAIAEAMDCPQNTLSTHLGILSRAQLVYGTRSGRSVIYRADVAGMRALMSFLAADCCEGHPQLCNFTKPGRRASRARRAKSPKSRN